MSRCLGFKLNASSTKIVLDAQRINFAQEFDAGFMPDANEYGVLFSGPNGNPPFFFFFFFFFCLTSFLLGVGKSAIGLLSFLNQFAQSRPVVYIPYGKQWVGDCLDSTDRPVASKARKYFIDEFFSQNADLIAATPSLFNIFRCYFDGVPPTSDLYPTLAKAVKTGMVPQCGFIIDESQVNFLCFNCLYCKLVIKCHSIKQVRLKGMNFLLAFVN